MPQPYTHLSRIARQNNQTSLFFARLLMMMILQDVVGGGAIGKLSKQQVIMGLSWAIRQSLLSLGRLHDGRTIIPLYTCVQMGIISMGQGSPTYWLLLNSHCTSGSLNIGNFLNIYEHLSQKQGMEISQSQFLQFHLF